MEIALEKAIDEK